MTDSKKSALFKELAEYLPYDGILTQEQKTLLLNLDKAKTQGWATTVYDYFYSHVDDQGNVISLQNFFNNHETADKNYYQKVNDGFVNQLFSKQKPLFFIDVDNTLTDEGYLSKQKINFINGFQQKKRIILTTGKAYDSIKNLMQDCGLSNNYASCINGSVLVTEGKTETIAKVGSVSKEITQLFSDAPFDTVVYYPDGIRLLRPLTQKNFDLLKKFNEDYKIEKTLDFSKVVKVLFFIYEGETQKEQLVKTRIAPYSDLVCMRTAGHTYEILNKNQHKGNTVKIISKLLGRYYRNTVGVGDSMNDAQLLNYVGKPFVVSTANRQLAQIGYQVCDGDRNTDIVNVIKKFE